MKRIAIIGSGGAGKSVLARQLGQRLALPVVHLDVLFWRPGWVTTPAVEWRARQEGLVAADSWIIDGNHDATMDVRLAAADTVVFLDLPRRVCLWRVVKRSLLYRRRVRADRADGCGERLDRTFLNWVWHYPRDGRPRAISAMAEHAGHLQVIHLTNRRDVEVFIDSVTPAR